MKTKKKSKKAAILSPENYIRQKSRNLPLGPCYILEEFDKSGMCILIISRQHQNGNITFCLYFVDLRCLGIKDTIYQFNVPSEKLDEIIDEIESDAYNFIKIPYEEAHNIIHAAVKYARKYGFEPCKDFTSITGHFLAEDSDDIPSMDIHCGGKSGKPFYINAGLESSAREKQILVQLEKTAGVGNFNCDEDLYDEDDDFDEYYEDDDDEEEDDEDDDELLIMKEYEALDFDEQKRLFVEFFRKKGGLMELFEYDELKRVSILSDILASKLVSDEEINELSDELSGKFNIGLASIDSFPNSLFTDVNYVDKLKLIRLFFDAFKAINSESKSQKAITNFRKEVGEAPVSHFVELSFLRKINREKYLEKLAVCYQKYPNYFLFQINFYADITAKEKELDMKFYEDILLNQTQRITTFEAEAFLIIYSGLLISNKNTRLVDFLAFEDFLSSPDYLSKDAYIITELNLKLSRLSKVYQLITSNSDEPEN